MANKFPLILNTSANQIQEIASGDNLDLTGCKIVGLQGINSAGIVTFTKAHVGAATTWGEDLVVTGNARVTGILTVGTNSVTISGNDVNITGVTTAANFKTGTSNLHNVGLEIAGINVLGADTPIGTGATIYNSGAAVFTGVVTATSFSGSGNISADGNVSGVDATFTGNVSINGQLNVGDSNADILQVGLKSVVSYGENTDVDTGTETVKELAIATYQAAFFDFVIKNGTNVRAGTITAAHDGTNIEFNEVSTVDLGNTNDVKLSVDISGGNMRLRATTLSDNWSVKAFVRAIKV